MWFLFLRLEVCVDCFDDNSAEPLLTTIGTSFLHPSSSPARLGGVSPCLAMIEARDTGLARVSTGHNARAQADQDPGEFPEAAIG